MPVGPPADGHSQRVAVGEVHLRLPVRALQSAPVLEAALQRPQLGRAEPAGMTLLQPLDNGRRFQPPGRLAPKQRLDLPFPHPVKGVRASAPPVLRLPLRWQGATLPVARRAHAHPGHGRSGFLILSFHSPLPQ